MARLVLTFKSKNFLSYKQMAKSLKNKSWEREAFRAVQDAGKKTRTKTQRAVSRQMGLKPGNYQSYVVSGTSSFGKKRDLSFTMYGTQRGASIEKYKGLRVLSSKGKAAKRFNDGRSGDKGFVLSAVWNKPRTFKRSFATAKGYFARLPGAPLRDPKNQPRDGEGRFAKWSGAGKKSRIRKLYGPSLKKEYVQGPALQEFQKHGPVFLETAIKKRAEKFLSY